MTTPPGSDGGPRARVIVVSDRAARGERPDATAALLVPRLVAAGFDEPTSEVVPDERSVIAAAIRSAARDVALVLTTGGTGLAPRDVTPEATEDVIERSVPGLAEHMRAVSRGVTPFADLSRGIAGTLDGALIINLPGSPKGAVECLDAVLPAVGHAVRVLRGAVKDCSDEVARDRS